MDQHDANAAKPRGFSYNSYEICMFNLTNLPGHRPIHAVELKSIEQDYPNSTQFLCMKSASFFPVSCFAGYQSGLKCPPK